MGISTQYVHGAQHIISMTIGTSGHTHVMIKYDETRITSITILVISDK